MKRQRMIDLAVYLAIAVAFVSLISLLALSNISTSRSKGLVGGTLSGVVLVVAVLQHFTVRRRGVLFG